jgi:arginase family enzyme
LGLVHFDTHTDTAREVFGVRRSHGTPMVEAGVIDAERYVQIALRGYWPGKTEFAWQRERGITALPTHEIRDRGIRAVTEDALAAVGTGLRSCRWTSTCWTPRSAPAPARAQPGGMTSADLLWTSARSRAASSSPGPRSSRSRLSTSDRATSPRSSQSGSCARS